MFTALLSSCSAGGDFVERLVGIKGGLEGGIGNDALVFTPNPMDFGNVPVGGSPVFGTVELKNNAKVAIKLKKITAPDSTTMTIDSQTCAIDGIMAVGETCTVRVQFLPIVGALIQDKVAVDFVPSIDESKVFTNSVILTGNGVAPLNFAGANPVLPADVSTTRVTVRWPTIAGASSFLILNTTSGTPVQVGSSSGAATSFTITGLNANTAYTFRVQALNVLGTPDANTNDQPVTTDALGTFGAFPALAASEGSNSVTADISPLCTDSESNTPQMMIINSQSDADLQCVLLTAPYRVSCTPNYKAGLSNWSGTVNVGCLLNDYPVAYNQDLTVNVSNTYRAPTIANILGQNLNGGQALSAVQANGSSLDSEALTYSCQYDQLVDSNVASGAADCNTLANLGGGTASFTAGGLFNWTPRLADGGKSFEFKVTVTGASSGLSASTLFVVNVGYPPPSPANSVITVASGTVNSGTGVTVTLQAKDSDGNNIPVGGATVVFSNSGGTSTGSFGTVTDHGNGTYTASFTGAVAGTATTIGASIQGSNVTSTLPNVTVLPGVISATTSVISVSSNTVTSGSAVTLNLQAKDAAGNSLTSGGASVVFSRLGGTSTGTIGATTDNGNGTYSATFTGILAGTPTSIKATVNSVSVTTTSPSVQVTPGIVSVALSTVSITGSPTTLAAGNTAQVKLTARDAAGNAITNGGLTVAFSFGGGGSAGSFGVVTDNSDGTYTAILTGSTSGSVSTVGATIGGVNVTSTLPTLTVVPGGSSPATSVITVGSASISSGTTTTLTLTAKDAFGNAIPTGGQVITFSRSGGTSTGTISATTDHNNGTYTAVFTGVVAGTATTISASIGGAPVTTTLPTIIVNPGSLSLATSLISVSAGTVASGSSVNVALQAKDAAGNMITSGGSTVVFNRSGGSSTGSFGPVTDNGNGSYTASFTGILAGTATTIGATANGLNITSTLPTVTVTPGVIAAATSTLSVSSATVASGANITLTLQAKDAAGNSLTSGGSAIAFSHTGGSSTGTIGSTTDNGNGTYTASFIGVLAGTATSIAATVDTVNVTTTLPSVTVTPGAASPATSTIAASNTTVSSGSSVTLTVQARDAAGNNITNGGATVVFGHTGGTATGSISSTTNVGNGTYTASFTGILAGTATNITASINGSPITTTQPTVAVTPGSLSLASSVVTVAASTVASGSSVLATLQAKDAAGNNITSGGATVVFSRTGGTSTGTFGATTDVGNGTYTSSFTGTVAGTATSIRATVNGSAVTSTAPTVTVTPGLISAATSTLSVSASTAASGSNITVTLTAKDAAGNNLTSGGSTVVFSHSGGTSTGTLSATTDNGNGTYSATFTGVVSGTATSIAATIGGTAVSTTLPTVTVTPGLASAATSTISVSGGAVASGSSVTLTVQAKDAAGNSVTVGGSSVAFSHSGGSSTGTISATTDNSNGTYTASFTGVLAGTDTTISATIGGSPITTAHPTVGVVPGPVSLANSLITMASSTVASGAGVLATLQTKDAAGNSVPVGGATVVFSRSGGTSTGSFGSTTDVGNGTYTANFTGVLAGTATTINATVNGVNVTSTLPTVTVTPGVISSSTSVLSVSSGTVNSGNSITLNLQAKDAAGNNLASGGSTVVFSHSGGSSTGTIGSTTDNGNGTYSASFTGVLAGTATSITATIGGSNVSTTSPSVTVNPGAASPATSLITASNSTVQSGSSVTLTLQAKDAAGNSLSTGGSTVVFSASGGTSTGTVGSTTNVGNGTYTASFTGVLVGTATTISATIGGSPVTTTLPTVSVTPGSLSLAASTITMASSTVASGSGVLATLQAKDAAGNNITSGGATVVFSRSGGTSTGTFGATTDVGNGTYTATFTGAIAGTATSVFATVNGSSVTSTSPTVTVTPGLISVAASTLSVSSATVNSGSNVTLTMQAKDAAGNNLTSGGSTVVFNYSGGTSTGTVGSTTDNGNGTYSATFTGVLAGTATNIGATIGGSNVTTSLPTVTVNPGAASAATSLIATSNSTVQSGSSVTLTVQAKDAAGNSLTTGSATVVFTHSGGVSTGTIGSTTDVGNGTYTANFTGVIAGSATSIAATINGSPITTTQPTVAVTPGSLSLVSSVITVASSTVASGSAVLATLQAKDAAGNNIPTGGSTVVFSRTGGTSTGNFGGTTDVGNGTYTANFTGILAGTATSIHATVNGSAVTSTAPTVTVTAGPIAVGSSTITVSSATVNSGNNVTLTLQGKDAAGNNLASGGSTVVFTHSGGTSTGSIGATTDNGNGTYSTSFTGVLAGTATTVQATIGGAAVTTTLPTVTVNPGAASPAVSVITASNSTVSSGSSVTLTVQAKDAAGNNLAIGGSTVVFTHSGGSSTGTISATTDVGNGTYTATFTGVLAGTATNIAASIGGSPITTPKPTVSVVPGAISLAQSLVTIDTSPSSVASGSSVTLRLATKDSAGNSITSGGQTVTFTYGSGTSTGTVGVVSDLGNGSYTASFTGAQAGTAVTIGATVGGVNVTSSPLPTLMVIPGPPSLASSLVSVASATVQSGLTTTVTLTTKDAFGNNLTAGGATVVFNRSGGASTGTFSATTDQSNGTYTAVFTGINSGTPTNIGATIGGSAVTSTAPTITVIPGPPSVATSLVSVSAGTVTSGNSVTLTLSTYDAGGNALSTGGATVVFSFSGGTSTGNISATTDNNNGTYTATFTGIAAGTATSIRATVNGSLVATTAPTVTVNPGAISAAHSTLAVSSATVSSGSSVNLTLTAKDANNNSIPTGGQTVVFTRTGGTSTGTISATTDNANGTYTASFAGIVAGTATTIQATINGTSVSTTLPTVTVVPGPLSLANSTVTASSTTIASGASSTLTLQAKDINGNNLTTGGSTVVFGTSGGSSTGNMTATSDNANGTYTATFTGVLAGTATTVTATAGGSAVTSTMPAITVNPGAVSLASSVVAVSNSTIASGSTVTLTLTAKDAAGNQMSAGGLTVVFSHTGGTSTGNIAATVDNNNGTYTSTFNALVAGSATTIRATIGGSNVSSTSPTITVTPGPVSLAQSTVAVSQATIASGNTSTITVTGRDANNNIITGGGHTVVVTRTGGSSTGNISAVTDNSNGTYTATFTGLVSGTATTINATINGSAVSSTLPTITVTPGALSLAQSTVAASSATIASGATSTLTFTAKDANGNNLTAGGSTVVFSISGGSSTGTFNATTDNGNGTYTATFTGVLAGTATTVNTTVGGSAVTSTAPTITVIPGAVSLANSTIATSAATLASGTQSTLTLVAKDSAGNQMTTGGLTVVFSRSGGTGTGNISATTDNNNGTYTATFNAIAAGTATTINATIGGISVTSGSPTITVVPGVISPVTSVVTVSSGTVASGASVGLTLQAKDVNGNNLTAGGETIVFSRSGGTSTGTVTATTDNGDGTYTSNFTGLVAGSATTINATVNGTGVSTTLPTVTVIPGAVSPATSVISLSQSAVQSGTSMTVTLTAKDAGGNVLTTGGRTVTFGLSGGSSTGTFGSVTDNANGTYIASFTGVGVGTPSFVGGTIDGVAISSTLPQVQVLVGAFSAANSALSVTSATVGAGGTTTLRLVARDVNNNNLTTGGGTVVFSISGGTSNGTIGSVVDNNDGSYSATFTGTTVGTAVTLGATYNGVPITSTAPTITVTPGALSLAQSVLSSSGASVASGSNVTLTLTAKDAYGNSILTGGRTVAFSFSGGTSTGTISATTDNGNGTYTASFTGAVAGTATTINATVDGSAVTSAHPTVTVNPGAISLASSLVQVSSGTVVAGNNITVTLQAKDAAGNNLTTGGQTVVFARSGGVSSGTFGSVTDNSNGTYTASFTGTTSGSATNITATINGSAVTSTAPTVIVTPGAVSLAQSTVSTSSGTVASGSNVTLTLQAKDAYSNNILAGGLTVVFARSGGTSTGTIGSTIDNGNGTYTATFTGAVAGTATTINATIGGAAVTSTSPTVTVTPGSISLAQSTVSVSSGTVASGSSSTLTLQAKDAAGNNITSGSATVVFSRSGGTSNGTIGSTTDNGDGTYSAIFTGTVAGTATTIGASINGSAVTSTLPTITVNAGPASLSQSLVSVSAGTVNSGSGITVTLQAKDASGNNLSAGGLTVAFGKTGGVSSGTFSAVTDNGNGTYTATFTGTTAGSATTMTASIGGSAVTSTLPTVTVIPGAYSLALSTVTLSGSTVASGSTVTATLTARDANNNNLTSGGLTVAFNRAGGTSNGTFGSVTDNGDGTYSVVFTGTTAGSATSIGATIGGAALTSAFPTLTVQPGPASLAQSLVTVSSSSVASGSVVTLTLTAKDTLGNILTPGGLSVAFNRSGGTSTGSIGPVTDNGNGTYTATFTGVVSGSATTIGATIGGSPVTSTLPTVTVIPGAVSLAQSTITTSAGSVASGSAVSVTLQAKDSAGNNLTNGGLVVVFGRSGGSSTGSFGSVTDNNNGTYTANFTGNVAGTATTMTGTIGGSAVTSTLPQVTVTPGPVSLAVSAISVSSSIISSGSTSTISLQAKDAAGNNILLGGLSVAFTYSGGTSTGTIGSVVDNSNGTYSAVFTGVGSGSATTISSTIGGSAVTSTLPTVTVNPGSSTSANSLITLSANTLSAGGTATITLQAKDASNNNITTGGATVSFSITGGTSSGTISAVTDNSNGTYTATFTATTAGTISTVGAVIDGSSVSSTLPTMKVNPGSISVAQSLVTVSSSSVVAGNVVLVTLQAKDAYSNLITTGGQTIVFARSGGTSNGIFSSVTDNTNGTYSANFQGTTAGSATTITATIGGVAVTSTLPTVAVSASTLSLAQSSISLSSGTVGAGNTITATLTARDAYNNPIATGGETVTFFRSGGTSNGTFGSVTDNSNGTYTVVFTGTASGTATSIGGNVGGSPITSALPTLTVTPGAVSIAQSTVSVGSSTLGSGTSSSLTLQAKDTYGNNITSGGLTVVFGRSGGTSNGTFGSVTDNGNGTYSGTFTGTAAGSATTITATIGGSAVSSTLPTITVIPGAVSLAQSTVVIVGSPSTVTSGSSVNVRLTARDTYGNQLTSGGLTVVFSRVGGTSTGSFSAVSDNNDGTYTADFTGAAAGTPTTIQATVGGSALTSSFPTISVVAGAPSLANSTVTVSSGLIASGSSSTVTLTARDSFGNQQSLGGLTVTFNASGGSSTGTFSSVVDFNNGTYSATFTGVLAGTATSIIGRISGVDLLSAAPTIQVGPGSMSPATSYITLTANSVAAGSTITATLHGRDAAGNDIAAGGHSISFNKSGGTSTGNFSAVTDFGDGDYAVNFQGVVAGTATAITATINTVPLTTTLPVVTVTPGALSLAQSTVTVSSAVFGSGTTSTVTVTTKDQYNNLITSAQTVAVNATGGTSTGTMSSVTNNTDGTYTATFTGTLSGTSKTVGATINGSAVTSTMPTLTVIPGAPSLATSYISITGASSVSGDNYKIVQGNAVTITLNTKDAAGNTVVVGGRTVGFSLSGGTSNGTMGTVADNSNGTYSATFTSTTGGTPSSVSASIDGAPISFTPLPTVEVLPLPVLTGFTNHLFDSVTPTPVLVGSTLTFNVNDAVVGGDANMTYTCVFDKTLDNAVAGGTNCTSLPPGATFNTSTGAFSWSPDYTAWGAYEIKLTGTNLAGSSTAYVHVNIQQPYPTTGLKVDLQGDFADYYTKFGRNSPATSTWYNLNLLSPLLNAGLSGFGWTTSSGWAGSGLKTDPYRLMFDGNNTYADLNTQLSSSDVMVSMWVKPSLPTAIDTSTGNANLSPVLFSSGGLTGNGIAIIQSPAEGDPSSGGSGKIELAVGGRMSWNAAMPILPWGRYRLNEASPSGGAVDSKYGTANNLNNTTSAPFVTTTGAFNSIGDTDAAMNLPAASSGPSGTARWLYSNTSINTAQTRSEFAWEFWFKTNSATPKLGGMVGASNSTTGAPNNCNTRNNFNVFMDTAGKVRFRVYDGGSDRTIISSSSYADTNWHHVVATMNSSTGTKLYIDGTLVGSNAVGVPWVLNTTALYPKVGGHEVRNSGNTDCAWTGATAGNNFAAFDGSLDEVHAYSGTGAELTAAQVAARANPVFCRSTTVLNSTTWYNIAVAYRSSNRTASLYINGSPECNAKVFPSGVSAVPSQNTTIGASPYAGSYTRQWTGGLSDFKLYDNVGADLSAQDTKAQSIYDAASPRHP
ncbi:invasin domain 3-containing protein [Bdellovibrio sp. HCB337]|uniref:invasin domain 3-containing protein n=1 Tax=Bdellovibrio sp. HCB337 TaxID=3394358 RepID=UPI0039A75732